MNIRPDPVYDTRSEAKKRQKSLELATEIHNAPEYIKPLTKQVLARHLPLRKVSDEDIECFIGVENDSEYKGLVKPD